MKYNKNFKITNVSDYSTHKIISVIFDYNMSKDRIYGCVADVKVVKDGDDIVCEYIKFLDGPFDLYKRDHTPMVKAGYYVERSIKRKFKLNKIVF